MGKKVEKNTPKELGNRTKSKGLQKLKYYCEMCQKQCRDANGFKCHLSSESHQRQLLLVAEDTEKYVRQFSREFEENYLAILKNEFGTKRVLANDVYQEIIREKNHVHMNSTRWSSLSGFVQHLGDTGKCKIDKIDEKGWFIQLIDKEAVVRKEEAEKKQKAEKDDEERHQEVIRQQVERGLALHGEQPEYKPTELIRSDDNEKIELSINLNKKPTLEELNKPTTSLGISVFDKLAKIKKEEPDDYGRQKDRDRKHRDDRKDRRSRSRSRSKDRHRGSQRKEDKPRKSALDEIKEMNERKKEVTNRKDYWLQPGIIVKIITKKLGNEFYKEKGVVKTMIDKYNASIKLDDGKLVKLDQSHVETVIPNIGREMLIVNGAYRGQKTTLESLDEKNFMLNLKICTGPLNGRVVRVAYEDASKLA